MGLFDKKKSAEQNPPTPEPEAPAASKGAVQAPASVVISGSINTPSRGADPAYGIRQAIELMRGLPGDNVDLVVHVVKKTLESMGIQIEGIVEDATLKQGEIEARAAV